MNDDEGDLVERGRKLRARRIRHQFSQRALAEAIAEQGGKMDRQTIKRVELGLAEADTTDRLEAWFDRYEEEIGDDVAAESAPEQIEVEFRDVFGIGQVIYRGTPENFPKFEATMEKLIQRQRQQTGDE